MNGLRSDVYEKVHVGYGFGERNEMGLRIMDNFAQVYELAIKNFVYRRREENYMTFIRGGNRM